MIWILVAHRADARIFKSTGRRGTLRLVREFDFPDGRRQNREIDTDTNGKRYNSLGGAASSQMKHGLDPNVEASEHVANIFAKELAVTLNNGRTHDEFDEVILVAEPRFLGKIRSFIDKETSSMVSTTLNRNLTALSAHEIVAPLDELVHSSRKIA